MVEKNKAKISIFDRLKYYQEKHILLNPIITCNNKHFFGYIKELDKEFVVLANDKDPNKSVTIRISDISVFCASEDKDVQDEKTTWLKGFSPEDLK